MSGAKPPHSYKTFIAYVKTTLSFIQQTKLRLLKASLNTRQTQALNIRQAIYLQRNIEACWCKHFCIGKGISVTYSECVFVIFP